MCKVLNLLFSFFALSNVNNPGHAVKNVAIFVSLRLCRDQNINDLAIFFYKLIGNIFDPTDREKVWQDLVFCLCFRLFRKKVCEFAPDYLFSRIPQDLEPMVTHSNQTPFNINRMHHQRCMFIELVKV